MRIVCFVAMALCLSCNPDLLWPEFERSSGSIRGFAVSMHPKAAREAGSRFPPDLREPQELGATHTLIPIEIWMQHNSASELKDGPDNEVNLNAVLWESYHHSLTPILMPIVRLEQASQDEWRGMIAPADESAWWSSYRTLLLHYAKLSQQANLPVLVIGSELSSMSATANPWCELASDIREVYDGQLAFVTNHDALDLVQPFACVDVAGVSAYFPLADSLNPTEQQLRDAWTGIGIRLHTFAKRVHKPVVLFELGYTSVDGSAMQPWNSTLGAPIDLDEQAASFRAAADEISSTSSWLSGVFIWTWLGPGGPHDAHFSPRGKPAIHEVERLLHSELRDLPTAK